jgi:hypothetical protein
LSSGGAPHLDDSAFGDGDGAFNSRNEAGCLSTLVVNADEMLRLNRGCATLEPTAPSLQNQSGAPALIDAPFGEGSTK